MTDFAVNNNSNTYAEVDSEKECNAECDTMSIYIPFVKTRYCYLKYVRNVFHELGIGWVARIRSPSIKSNNNQSLIIYMQ